MKRHCQDAGSWRQEDEALNDAHSVSRTIGSEFRTKLKMYVIKNKIYFPLAKNSRGGILPSLDRGANGTARTF